MNKIDSVVFKKISASGLTEKDVISSQFVKIVDRLIQDQHFESKKHFSEHYGYHRGHVDNIKRGLVDVSGNLLYTVVLDWKINPLFVFALSKEVYFKV